MIHKIKAHDGDRAKNLEGIAGEIQAITKSASGHSKMSAAEMKARVTHEGWVLINHADYRRLLGFVEQLAIIADELAKSKVT